MFAPQGIRRALRAPPGAPPHAFRIEGLMDVALDGESDTRAERLTCLLAQRSTPDDAESLFRSLSYLAARQAWNVFVARARDGRTCIHMLSPVDTDETAAATAFLSALLARLGRAP